MDEELLSQLREAVGGQRPGNPNVWDSVPVGQSTLPGQQGQAPPMGLLSFVRNPTQRELLVHNQEQHIMMRGLSNQPRLRRGEHFHISVVQTGPTTFETVALLGYSGRFSRQALYTKPLFEDRDWVGVTIVFGEHTDSSGGFLFAVKKFIAGEVKEARLVVDSLCWTFEIDQPLGRLAGRPHLVAGF
jgi:hypothetical protein